MVRITIACVLVLVAPVITPATAKPSPVRPIIGLENGEAITFTSSPDGGVLSILYDKARVQVLAADPPVPGNVKTLMHRFRVVLGRPAQVLSFNLRGFRSSVAPDGTGLTLAVSGNKIDLTPVLTDQDFDVCADVPVAGRTVDVIWTATARQVPGQETLLELDSIDIAALKAGAKAQKPRECKAGDG